MITIRYWNGTHVESMRPFYLLSLSGSASGDLRNHTKQRWASVILCDKHALIGRLETDWRPPDRVRSRGNWWVKFLEKGPLICGALG